MTALTTRAEPWLRLRPRPANRASPWGLELGENHFTIARLGGSGDRPGLRRSGHRVLESGPAFGDPSGAGPWVDALREARREETWGAREVVASLPGSQVDTFPLRIEANDPASFLRELGSQAAERLPYPLAEAVVDCIEPSETGATTGGRRVILVAARSSVVEFALECLREAGFQPRALEIPATALARLHRALYPADTRATLVVNPGDMGTTITCVRAGVPLVTRSIPWGVTRVLERLEGTLRLPRSAVLRCLAGYRPESGDGGGAHRTERVLATLLGPHLEELAGEVDKVWTYARAEFRSQAPERILLTGRASLIPAIGNYLQGLTGEPVAHLDPAEWFTGAAPGSPELAVPLGLALRDSPWLSRN
jgi:Tfp pilus assembly PilM family ATPase